MIVMDRWKRETKEFPEDGTVERRMQFLEAAAK